MDDIELKQQVNKKLFLINSFLYTGSLGAKNDPGSVLKHAVSNHFLQAVILELIIKMLYELDQKDTAPFTHNILKIFNKLNQDTKEHLVSIYDKARTRRKQQFIEIDDVQFHPLEDVLANNESTIKNFKYDAMGISSNSSVDGMFYQEVFKYVDSLLSELNV